MLTQQDLNILEKDRTSNISMLGFFAKHDASKILRIGESIMAQGRSDEDWWYLALANEDDFSWFLNHTRIEDRYIAAIEDSILEKVKQKFTCRWVLSCQRFYLPNDVILPELGLTITTLNQTDAKHIHNNSNYKTYTSENYIQEQITNGPSAGYHDNSVLAGWILTHDDGALGALHVLNLYRRQGIARALVVDLTKKVRSMGLIPYTYIEPSNIASLELFISLGFIPDRPIHWVCLNR